LNPVAIELDHTIVLASRQVGLGRLPGQINRLYGGRGVYFSDPSGHQLELMATRYGDPSEFQFD
jgi:hypothetical protein